MSVHFKCGFFSAECKILLKLHSFTGLTNRLQINLWRPVNDVILGASPHASSPICQFIVHASCKLKYAQGAWCMKCFNLFLFLFPLLCIIKLIPDCLLRHPGISISGGSQLHHQHQGQELSFVTANALQSAMEPSLSQCGSQRLDLEMDMFPHYLLRILSMFFLDDFA